MRDLANNVVAVQSITPVQATASGDGDGVDLTGFESATIVVSTGVEGDTLSSTVKIDFKLEDSSDDVTYTAVSSGIIDATANANGIFLTLDDNAETPQVTVVGYVGGKKYVRVVGTLTGTHTNGTPISATVIKGHPIHAPT